jgi:6-pyruvoyltetrahydropterin/6-carboxytetrahydropterin synthase
MKTAVYRKEIFSATHRLHNPNWDDEKNIKVFGKCNNPEYHGHNYELVVKIIGEVDEETGYVVDAKIIKDIIKKHVMDRYDHKNLYNDVDDFKDLNPTSENIARKIYENIKPEIDPKHSLQIRLYETSKIFVDYPA